MKDLYHKNKARKYLLKSINFMWQIPKLQIKNLEMKIKGKNLIG